VTQVYPLYIAREIERRWQRRFPIAAEARAAQNDNRVGGGLCPLCNGYASIGANATESCGKGVVRHHWLCRACGHEWVTVLHVLA
jgi:hypothetical protein